MRALSLGFTAVAALFALWIGYSLFIVHGIEEAAYRVIDRRDGYEIRRYEPAVVAEVAMPSLAKADRSAAFWAIAGYIFGDNAAGTGIAMTAPVVMTPSAKGETIAMTAPVVMGDGRMAFVMPSKFKTVASLPRPNDQRVKLREAPGRTVAALAFSWYSTGERVAAKMAELEAKLVRDKVTTASMPYLASYNPPFSVPFLMRHEILVDLAP